MKFELLVLDKTYKEMDLKYMLNVVENNDESMLSVALITANREKTSSTPSEKLFQSFINLETP